MIAFVKCANCHGSGTVFPGKGIKANSKKCPVCKGKCKVPADGPAGRQ